MLRLGECLSENRLRCEGARDESWYSSRPAAGMRGFRMRSKGLLALLAIGLTLGLTACEEDDEPAGPAPAPAEIVSDDGQKVYFSFRDPAYDDRGAGSYTYPLIVDHPNQTSSDTSSQGAVDDSSSRGHNLDTKTGLFDITKFEVVDGGPNVIFEITTTRPIPKYRDDQSSEAKGWFLQLMDIYIDKDRKPGSGRTRTIPGRNLSFSSECGWEKVILVTPQVSWDVRRLIEQITWDLDFIRMKNEIYLPDQIFIEGYTFRVFVPKSEIGVPQPNWGYQCLMMLFNPSNLEYGHFQQGKVKRFAGNNVFGGADEYNGHPNVIDLLAPTPEDQYRWLSDFVSSPNAGENRYAQVPMIYAEDAHRKTMAKSPGVRRRIGSEDRSNPYQGLAREPVRTFDGQNEEVRMARRTSALRDGGERNGGFDSRASRFVRSSSQEYARGEATSCREQDAVQSRRSGLRTCERMYPLKAQLDDDDTDSSRDEIFSNTGASSRRTTVPSRNRVQSVRGYQTDRFDVGETE